VITRKKKQNYTQNYLTGVGYSDKAAPYGHTEKCHRAFSIYAAFSVNLNVGSCVVYEQLQPETMFPQDSAEKLRVFQRVPIEARVETMYNGYIFILS
jgi:hypothetical protein